MKSGALSAIAAGLLFKAGVFGFGQSLRPQDPALDFQIPYAAQQNPVFYFTRSTFEPYVGGIFQTRAVGGKRASMTLLPVRDCTPKATSKLTTKPARQTDCFALTFRSNAKLSDLTTIYRIEHAALGQFDLFLTEHGATRGGYIYEAVINHAR